MQKEFLHVFFSFFLPLTRTFSSREDPSSISQLGSNGSINCRGIKRLFVCANTVVLPSLLSPSTYSLMMMEGMILCCLVFCRAAAAFVETEAGDDDADNDAEKFVFTSSLFRLVVNTVPPLYLRLTLALLPRASDFAKLAISDFVAVSSFALTFFLSLTFDVVEVVDGEIEIATEDVLIDAVLVFFSGRAIC